MDRIRDSFARQGMMATLGAALVEAGPGRVVIAAPVSAAVSQQHGFAHAALAFAIGDSAAGYSALGVAPEGSEVLTIEMKIHLLAPAAGDRLRAEGRVVRAGRRVITTAADVYAESAGGEAHVATLLGSMMVVAP